VEFLVQPTDTGTIVLRPVEKKIPMRVRFSVKLIEWKIPWNEVIMLNTIDLIKPVLLPANIQGTIAFPTLAQDPKEKYGTVSRDIIVRDVNVMAAMQVLDWRCNIELRKGKK
jgi:hypothetical protein